MFVPSADNNWQGNLKSYRLNPDGLVVDANGDEAIDKDSGLFKNTSRSYWTAKDTVDGDQVTLGGAASNLTKEKNIFTHLSNNKGTLTQTISTSNISKSDLGLADNTSISDHQALIDWINRKEGINGSRQQMEDPLHSRPIVVNYGYSQDPITKDLISDSIVFVGTNSGYLHAFKADKDNFEELFSYIPKELLSNANLYRTKDVDQSKVYGVDGPINYWHVDANQDLQVDSGEKVYLFFGLRRGGRHYYALDITDKNAPKFQWQISGGQGGDFDKMGQSWSQMKLAKVRWGDSGKTKVVLLVGGGYDTAEDNRDSREVSNIGNAIYMIDPETGGLLWSASNTGADTNLTDMTSSITSDIKTIDFDGDQITDYFFVSDLGGRVWRFDLNPNKEKINEANFINGAGMIFDANKDSSKYQRFYDAPSISYFSNPETKEKFLTVSIGSGFRASPLKNGTDDSKDSFYVIKDPHITVTPSTYTLPARSDFKDITSTATAIKRNEVDVWKYDLTNGEKILSSPLTANGNIFFTTFLPSPTAASSDSCNTDIGSSRVYTVNFLGDEKDLGLLAPAISSAAMPNIGIPPQVVELITTETGQKLFCESNPGHESCKPKSCELTGTCPDECESTGSVILSGTHVVGGSTLRCDLLKKDYWRSL
jgi:type IV pilus assembly protein PilY1